VILFNPQFVAAYAGRCRNFYFLERYLEAIDDCSLGISIDNDLVDLYIHRGNAQDSLGNHNAAIADYSLAISLEGDRSDAFYNRALAYNYLQDYQQALANYNRSIDLNPQES